MLNVAGGVLIAFGLLVGAYTAFFFLLVFIWALGKVAEAVLDGLYGWLVW
jgi:hypothetical protein